MKQFNADCCAEIIRQLWNLADKEIASGFKLIDGFIGNSNVDDLTVDDMIAVYGELSLLQSNFSQQHDMNKDGRKPACVMFGAIDVFVCETATDMDAVNLEYQSIQSIIVFSGAPEEIALKAEIIAGENTYIYVCIKEQE